MVLAGINASSYPPPQGARKERFMKMLGLIVIGAVVVITGGVVIQQTQVGLSDLLTGVTIVAVAATIGNQADRRRMSLRSRGNFFRRIIYYR